LGGTGLRFGSLVVGLDSNPSKKRAGVARPRAIHLLGAFIFWGARHVRSVLLRQIIVVTAAVAE
jgi:hypothetical protein